MVKTTNGELDGSSKEEQAWLRIAANMREALSNLVDKASAMSPSDLRELSDCLNNIIFLERSALCFDKHVKLELGRFDAG